MLSRLPCPAAVIFRVWLVTALTRLGEFGVATREAAKGLGVAERADQPLALLVPACSTCGRARKCSKKDGCKGGEQRGRRLAGAGGLVGAHRA